MAEHPVLSRGVEALVALSGAIATRDGERVAAALRDARDAADPLAVDEIILQSHLFVGFPDALRAIALWREIGPTGPVARERKEVNWERRGERTCQIVYAANYSRLRTRMASLHPDFDRWMVEGGYGRVIGRPQVDLVTRELCIVALLAVWNALDQLHSHLRGALHAGASAEEVRSALEIAMKLMDERRGGDVWMLWGSVQERLTARRVANGADSQ